MSDIATKSAPNAKGEPDTETTLLGPPDEQLWEKYNKRLEFPLATVCAVLVHILIGAVLVFVLVRLMNKEDDRSGVSVKLIEPGGLDDDGAGSKGSGGEEDPIWNRDADQMKSAITNLIDPAQLPDIKQNIQQAIKYLDPTGNLPISDANAAAYASLDEKVRNKLLQGAKQGSGKGDGSGSSGEAGKGPGGSSADSTLGRSMRWVLRFKVAGGRDYLEQLKAMDAKILIPMPGSEKCILVDDLGKPNEHRVATDADMRMLGGLQQFSDGRRDAVQGIAGALGLDFTPKTFWAFFPKGVEEELAMKEKNHRNRRSEDIAETIFKVTIRGGSYEIVVDEQKIKR